MSDVIATVAQLYFYPVKSMAGISLQQAYVGFDGILGDRQYAFVHTSQAATNSFPWMTARQSSRMLLYQPQLDTMPTPDDNEQPVLVRTPDGTVRAVDDSVLCDEIAAINGNPLFLLKSNRGNFDAQHLSLFSLTSVDALASEAGSAIDHRQFRANIYMQPASGRAFDEEAWTGHLLQVGKSVLVGITKRDGRCMIVNLDPTTGDQNPAVLRAIAQRHDRQAGVYGNIIRRGLIRVGDEIRLVGKA
jgi:uncharacterized protein YcbX